MKTTKVDDQDLGKELLGLAVVLMLILCMATFLMTRPKRIPKEYTCHTGIKYEVRNVVELHIVMSHNKAVSCEGHL